jgi:hypothetical protein
VPQSPVNGGFSRIISATGDWGDCVVADAVGYEPVSESARARNGKNSGKIARIAPSGTEKMQRTIVPQALLTIQRPENNWEKFSGGGESRQKKWENSQYLNGQMGHKGSTRTSGDGGTENISY